MPKFKGSWRFNLAGHELEGACGTETVSAGSEAAAGARIGEKVFQTLFGAGADTKLHENICVHSIKRARA